MPAMGSMLVIPTTNNVPNLGPKSLAIRIGGVLPRDTNDTHGERTAIQMMGLVYNISLMSGPRNKESTAIQPTSAARWGF